MAEILNCVSPLDVLVCSRLAARADVGVPAVGAVRWRFVYSHWLTRTLPGSSCS